MALLRNSLVFLDTGPLREYGVKKSEYAELFRYSTADAIKLCTSWMSIQEWVEQKISHYNGYRNSFSNLFGENCFVGTLLDRGNFPFPDEEDFREKAYREASTICKTNHIEVFASSEDHIKRTWGSYFRITPPFRGLRDKENIPDAWVYEAALDAFTQYRGLSNKFVVSSEKNKEGKISTFLQQKGFKPITLLDLLQELKNEENNPETPPPQPSQPAPVSALDAIPDGDLAGVLGQFVGTGFRDIAIGILGYSHWFKAPHKEFLRQLLQDRGHSLQNIDACSQLLSYGAEGLITLTGSNYIPRNTSICKLAAEKIKPEIIKILQESE